MTNAEVLVHDLKKFEFLEDFQKEALADYIACPNSPDCKYDGGHDHGCCSECKVKWLESEWEG